MTFLAFYKLNPDRSQERLEVSVEIFGKDSQIPVEKVEELLFHEIDFSNRKSKIFETSDCRISSPVLVLG